MFEAFLGEKELEVYKGLDFDKIIEVTNSILDSENQIVTGQRYNRNGLCLCFALKDVVNMLPDNGLVFIFSNGSLSVANIVNEFPKLFAFMYKSYIEEGLTDSESFELSAIADQIAMLLKSQSTLALTRNFVI